MDGSRSKKEKQVVPSPPGGAGQPGEDSDDGLPEGVRTKGPPKEAYTALSTMEGFGDLARDFGQSRWGPTAGCPFFYVKTIGGEEPLLQRYRCLLCGCAGGKDVVVDPAHLVSGDHVRNLQAWPEKEELVRAAGPEEDVGRRMSMIARWIKEYGPGPHAWDYATSREGIKSGRIVMDTTKNKGRDVQVLGWVQLGVLPEGGSRSSWNSEGENLVFERGCAVAGRQGQMGSSRGTG